MIDFRTPNRRGLLRLGLPLLAAPALVRGSTAFAAEPAGRASAIAIADFPVDRIFQRDPRATSEAVMFHGTYKGGAPASIDVKVDVVGRGNRVPFTPLSNFSASEGQWRGTLNVPQGAWYKATARENASRRGH